MSRPTKYRCVEFIPEVNFFQPGGVPSPGELTMPVEEFEAIRLKDLEGLDQIGCAQRMHVSRATFQRVLESARRKMAEALVNGKAIHVQGGNFRLAVLRFRCAEYGHEWEVPFEAGDIPPECPRCYSSNVYCINQGISPGKVARHRKKRRLV